MRKKILFSLIAVAILLAGYASFLYVKQHQETSNTAPQNDVSVSQTQPNDIPETVAFAKKIDMKQWLHNAEDRVYYQLGISYCGKPAAKDFEKLAIFVPEQFLNCNVNADKTTYTCKPNNAASVGGFTIHTAPIIMPVETKEYEAIPALSTYIDVTPYTNAGYTYVYIGSRGIESAAPAAVADFKAAIRFLRHNKANIPANTDLIYALGVRAGGTISAILGTSGDSALYMPYLQNIGAIETTGDSIYGVFTWYPVSDFGIENSAYEWSIGVSRKGVTENQHKLSNLLARDYANYVNNLGLIGPRGLPLFLQPSDKGVFKAGPYYEHLKSVVEDSLTKFIRETTFPYTPPRRTYTFGKGFTEAVGEINPQGTFLTAQQYLKALNEKRKWVSYDYSDRVVIIRNVEDFLRSFKPATQEISYFDPIKRNSWVNSLFRTTDKKGLHFDDTLVKIYKNHPLAKEYTDDIITQDTVGLSVRQRRNMYSPMYFVSPASGGYKTAKVAPFWRIRTGLRQTEFSLTNEINLSLALKKYPNVNVMDFETFWAQEQTDLDKDGKIPSDLILQILTKYYFI